MFQTAWLREFRLVFGSSTPASAAVLAIFMGGLGLGNAVLGRRVDAHRNPLAFYAQLEFGISLAALVSPFLVQTIAAVYIAVGGQQTLGLFGATFVRLLLSAVVLGVPTFLMGGTLAAAAKAVTSPDDAGRGAIGLLYGLNTLGAVVGATLSTFFLTEWLGTRGTLWLACGVNLGIALAAAVLAKNWRPLVSKSNQRTEAELAIADASNEPIVPARLYYIAAGVVGFAFLLMELVWYRMLGPLLGGSTFTFGLILAVALAGIGIGGALYPVLFRNRRPTIRDFALTCGWEALAIAVPFALGDRLAVLALILRDLSSFGFYGQVLGWWGVAAIVVFPAALVSGIQFPLLIALLGKGNRDVGKQVGQACAWNTIGAMLGSLAGGFGLLPLLTAPGSWMAVAILLVALGGVMLWQTYRIEQRLTRLVTPLAIVGLALVCLWAIGPTAVWRHSGIGAGRSRPIGPTHNDLQAWLRDARRKTIWEAEGRESSVAIDASDGVAFIVNGKSDGNSIGDAPTQMMLGMLGPILHPGVKTGLVIGLGTGESAGWLAAIPSVEKVDVVELEPAIVAVAQACSPLNHDVLNNPKVQLVFNDAREVLLTTPQKYDLIVSEPSNPYRAGVASLYTHEFYQATRERLNDDGLFVQWLQGYEIDARAVRSVLATLHAVYPNVEVWQTNSDDLLLVCSARPRTYDVAAMREWIATPVIREGLSLAWRANDLEGVFARYIAGPALAEAVARDEQGRVNTDDGNALEYGFARSVGRPQVFSPLSLRLNAVVGGADRPGTSGGEVDWELAEDQRLQMYFLGVRTVPPFKAMSPEQGKRILALQRYLAGDLPGAIEAWSQQPRQPQTHTEVALFAAAHAEQNDEQATALIEQLRKFNPIEAEGVEALQRIRAGETEQAVEKMERVFVGLRTMPMAHSSLMEPCFSAALDLAQNHPEYAQRLLAALREPFAVLAFQDRRLRTMYAVARHVNPQAAAEVLEIIEPNPYWDLELLQARLHDYTATQHPLEKRARRDLAEYEAHAGEELVLPVR